MRATYWTTDGLLEVSGSPADQDELVWSSTATDEEDARAQLAVQFGIYGQSMELEVRTS